MPSYVRQVPFELEYDGQKISGTLKPLLFTDAIRLRGVSDNREQAVVDYAAVLPTYLIGMTPIRDAAGGEVPVEEVLAATFYAGLVAAIMQAHLEAAAIPNPPKPAAAHVA